MANDIDKTSPHYKGEFGSIYEVSQKFPSGGVEGDYVAIDGWAHYWNADRGTWCVNAQRDSYWDELITGIIEKFKLFKGATYMGVAGLDTVPAKAIGAKMYYFATVAGTYKNFGGLVVPQGINVLYSENGSSWVCSTLLEVAQELGVSTRNVVSQKVVNDALNLKANQSSVNEALAKKADKETVNTALGKKADTTDVNTRFTEEKNRLDAELAKKFDKENVAQESGESEDKVMSQKAVSTKLNDLTYDIHGGEKDIVKKSYTSESNSVNIPIDGTIVKYGDTITLKLSEPISATYTIQTRTEDSSIGEKSLQFTDGYATYDVTTNTVAKSLKIVNCNKNVSIVEKVKKESIDDNIAALKKNVETIESKNSLLGNSIDIIKDNIDGKDLHLNSYIADGTYIDIKIESPFVYGGTYRFQSDYFENKTIKYSYRNSEFSSIGEKSVQATNGYITITITSNPNAKYLRFPNLPKGTKIDYVSKESTVGYRLEKVEKAIDNIDKVIKHNSIKYGSELKAVKTQPGEIYENCMFLVPSVIVSENVTFRKCDFVNCVVTPSESVTKDMIVEHCNFIGSNARLQMKFLENCQILYNDFKISDSAYPDAAPKTKGENSRNIFVHSINNTKIIGNRIRIGRTGICVLGFKEDVLYEGNLSSCNNVISGNQIDGIGEEHISFDGGVLYDVAKITSFDSIDFVEEDTGQGQENNTENTSMTKIVAKITCSLKDIVAGTSSNCPSDNSFLKNYSHLGNGSFHIVNERNGLHSAVDSFEIVGTMKEDGDYRYASEGTYKISFRMPTIYNYKRQMSEDAKAKMIAKFKEHFAVDDEVVITTMQNYNVISNNVINGIGTDCVTDIDTQGGIVLYSFCFHNVVNGNVLHQKRIWAQGWHSFNYHSKVKMQCDNVISNNTLDNTSISFVYHTLNTPTAYKMNKRNRIVNNVVTGVNDVASIQIDNTEDTYLCGNMANSYRIKNNDKLKMVANSLSGLGMGEGYMTNNTNTVKDETNQVQ